MTRPARVPPSPDPAVLAALKARVIDRTGHFYYADKDAMLWERIADRMAACRIADAADYLALLDDPADGEWRALESAVTINETFFFRFAEQFRALRETILPGLIAARADTRRLRIWSPGCSTGAEPYSIAVLLHDLLGAGYADWRISIVGTDIDEAALAAARTGLFGGWALRTLDEAERDRLFERDGPRFRLRQPYRGSVRFERHNLMTLTDGTSPLQFADYDLILCRNVLIYFRIDVATAIVGGLAERLSPDGWLLVGHAEANAGFDVVATPQQAGGILAYRRLDLPAPPVVAGPVAQGAPAAIRAPRPRPAAIPPETIRARSEPSGDAVTQYLAALNAIAAGDAAAAEWGFRRALYLDSSFVMAHYLFGRHLIGTGRAADGRRSLANAGRIAATLPADTILQAGDGMTAAEIVAAVRYALTPA